MNMFRLKLLATAALMLVPSTQAFAQDSSATARSDNQSIETIVVTAQKRAENVQDVPLSIVAFSGGTLVANNVSDVKGLEKAVVQQGIERGGPAGQGVGQPRREGHHLNQQLEQLGLGKHQGLKLHPRR